MIERLQDHDAAALTDDESIAAAIERAGGSLGIVVSGREGPHSREAGDESLVHARLRTAGEHHVGIAPADRLPGLPDGVAAAGASGYDGEVGSGRAERDGHDAGRQVAYRHRDQKRRQPIRATLAKEQDLVCKSLDAAHTRADDDAGPLGLFAFQAGRQAGLVHRLPSGDQSKLSTAIVAPLSLVVQDARRIEALDLGPDPGVEPRGVELRDGADARSAGDHSFPGGFDVETQRGEGAHAGNDDAGRMAVFVGRLAHRLRRCVVAKYIVRHRTSFPVRMVAARYTSPGRPRADTELAAAMTS